MIFIQIANSIPHVTRLLYKMGHYKMLLWIFKNSATILKHVILF